MSHFTVNERIYYQNGMQNTRADAESGVQLLAKLGQWDSVTALHNNTDGTVGDILEYLPNDLSTKDVLNAHQYTKIAKNGGTVVAFSAGNEDAYKAMRVLALQGKTLDNQVNLVSVGSPVSKGKLQRASDQAGVTFVGQYNDWKDPVTNSKTWMAGAGGLFIGGLFVGGYVATDILMTSVATNTAIGGYFKGLVGVGVGGSVGGGIGGSIGIKNLSSYHSFERYLEDDVNGIRTLLQTLPVQSVK